MNLFKLLRFLLVPRRNDGYSHPFWESKRLVISSEARNLCIVKISPCGRNDGKNEIAACAAMTKKFKQVQLKNKN